MLRKFIRYSLLIGGICSLLITGTVLDIQLRYAHRVYTVETVTASPIAIVLGASIKPDGTPSDALMDRILTGAALYEAEKVSRILLTGDGGDFRRNEIVAMKRATINAGVPEEAIVTDDRGFRTYESCKRAQSEFGITNAIVVTQRFHLGRALSLCNHFGVDSDGVPADRQPYRRIIWHWTRDLLSSVKAFWDLHLWAPTSPV